MVFYDIYVHYLAAEQPQDEDEKRQASHFKRKICSINEALTTELRLKDSMTPVIYNANDTEIFLFLALKQDKQSLESCRELLLDVLQKKLGAESIEVETCKEISVAEAIRLCENAEDFETVRSCRRFLGRLHLDFMDCAFYKFHEKKIDELLSYEQAVKRADELMADVSFYEELERIYSAENVKRYYGHPVHYVIKAGDKDAAKAMAELLVISLRSNQRLLGSRINYIDDVKDSTLAERELDCAINSSQGNTVVFCLEGPSEGMETNYADTSQEVVDLFEKIINKYSANTLCIFFHLTDNPGYAPRMVARMQGSMDLVEILEGSGSRLRAEAYLKGLAKEGEAEISTEELQALLGDRTEYRTSDLHVEYRRWMDGCLKERYYKAYKDCKHVRVPDKAVKNHPYKELQSMIGLQQIKEVVNRILDTAKVQHMRARAGLMAQSTSRHMIFTGAPGSAKTTVARLLAGIFYEEGIIRAEKVVECGRADLVGKYVGWTAKQVRIKFREARGGILFIDEAYSLVDGSNSFGDEAINTIVQEMENQRDDLIVIFAGYPDRMREFLDKNEGLRSRIAFHLEFPDYTAEELVQILDLMAEKKGYSRLGQDAKEKAMKIFEEAVKTPDYGNGRYVRNVLEKAIMHQCSRLIGQYKGKRIAKSHLLELTAQDFEAVAVSGAEQEKRVIGFV